MNSERLRRNRAFAEWRFKAYGILGLSVATLALVLLLVVIIGRGSAGLMQTQIRVTGDGTDIQSVKEVSWRGALRSGLARAFPEAGNDPGARRKLMGLLSDYADLELKQQAKEMDKILLKETPHVYWSAWLTASDAVDRYVKTDARTRDTDPSIKLDDKQKQWVKDLETRGKIKGQFIRTVFNVNFFTHGDSRSPEQAGFLSSMMGSLLTLLVCLGVAFPLGVLSAVYLEEFAAKNKWVDFIEVNINNLAAVPSIVFGLLGLAIYLNVFGMPRSAPVVGGLTLALMILPTIIIATRASIKSVPGSIRDAARALGASPIQVVFHHVVPLAVPGIMTGTILGLARAIGETAPLLLIGMVAFVADVPTGFTDPAAAMPVQIYLWASSPELSFVEKTAAGIMVLLGILLLMNAVAIAIRRKFEHHW